LEKMLKVEVTDNEFAALLSLLYNIGSGNLQNSTLLRKLNSGDLKENVAAEFLKWDKSGGQFVQGLLNRREDERLLFLS